MNYEMFVKEIFRSAPKTNDLIRRNLPSEYITNCINSYNIPKKEINSFNTSIQNNEILKLLNEYDCTNLQIGNIRFLYDTKIYEEFYQIGNLELDFLCISKINNEIQVRDHESLTHIIWPCSKNDKSFLDSLVICSNYFTEQIKNDLLISDDIYRLGVIKQCSITSGGMRYLDFYKMLLGYFI